MVALEKVHRFTDPDYAALSLRMRTGDDIAAVFDALHRRGSIVIHPSDSDRTAALAEAGAAGDLVVADTREQVASLNAAIRDQRRADPNTGDSVDSMVTARGERIGLGDRVATRRNDPDLGVANRQTWTVTDVGEDGSLTLRRRERDRLLPAEYATKFVELAYATTVHGAQGETVDDAKRQWIAVFGRDRADLGPAHAKRQAIDAIDRYGAQKRRQPVEELRRQTPAPGGAIGF